MFKTLPLIAFAAGLLAGVAQADTQDGPTKLQVSAISQKKDAPKPEPGVASEKTAASAQASKAGQEETRRPDPGYLNGGYFGE
ncbi:MAG: hypothetical protein ACLGHA_00735 [Gammaproteobacteria bacterium]